MIIMEQKKNRPAAGIRFDTTKTFYRDRDDAEPMLEISAKGKFRLDLRSTAAVLLAVSALALLSGAVSDISKRTKK